MYFQLVGMFARTSGNFMSFMSEKPKRRPQGTKHMIAVYRSVLQIKKNG